MIRYLLVILLLVFCCNQAYADWGPWETGGSKQIKTSAKTDIDPLKQMVRFFQKNISSVDGARCPMYPTCSGYSIKALHKHGPFIGTMMTVDRLYRESDPIEKQDKIVKWGVTRFFDPVEKNDFWLVPHK